MTYEPKAIVMACHWCSYAGADLAGVSRFQYPSTTRIIRTMCSGRLDPGFVLRAFEKGIDGVMIMGCHPGDCHYVEGNLRAEKKFEMIKALLQAVGMDPERVRLEWVSASEGMRFAELIKEFTETLMEKGPTPMNKKEARHGKREN